MQPTLIREPFHRAGWVYEEKVDGWRIMAYKDSDRVRLVSRNGVDHTRRFADIAAAMSKLSARTLVLDGEVAIYDDQLRSRFAWLRYAVPSPPRPLAYADAFRYDPRPPMKASVIGCHDFGAAPCYSVRTGPPVTEVSHAG